jgi:hypothetical protein
MYTTDLIGKLPNSKIAEIANTINPLAIITNRPYRSDLAKSSPV